MLVEIGVDLDRRGVETGLVREGAGTGVGLAGVGRDVGDLADRVADPGRLGEAMSVDDLQSLLELEVGDDGDEVGIAGALAVTVDRSLDMSGTGIDGRHRVGDRAAGVVVAVDPHA